MSTIKQSEETKAQSVGKIIDIIRTRRNDLIKDLLKDGNLLSYFEEHYKKKLSHIKEQFLKRDLSELLIAPVDLVHYAGLIKQLKETNTASLTEENEGYFYQELDSVFKKYSF